MRIRPLHDRVIVKRTEEEEKTKGGIIIPDTAKEKGLEGKVVAVGAGRIAKSGNPVPMAVKVGDKVLIGRYSGQEVTLDDVEYMILKEADVLGIIE